MIEFVRGIHLDHNGKIIACNGMHLQPTPYGWCVTSWTGADQRLRDCPRYPQSEADVMTAVPVAVITTTESGMS